MNNNKNKEQTRLFDRKSIAELWKSMEIDFLLIAEKFPYNKIYGTIGIEPESARQLIKNFILIVDDCYRGEFESNYQNISISGFDIEKEKPVNVKIQAVPIHDNCNEIKESEYCEFAFNSQSFVLSPIVGFEWHDDNPVANTVVKWHHINNQSVQKYVLCLDKKEIHYVHQRSFSDILEICIHNLEPGKNYTIQIISKLNNEKVTYQSDPFTFTVPKKKAAHHTEVLHVRNESVPFNFPAFIKIEEKKKGSLPEPPPSPDPVPEPVQLRDRVLELLQKLKKQIEERKP